MHGDAGRILPISTSGPRTAKLISGARLVVIEGAHGRIFYFLLADQFLRLYFRSLHWPRQRPMNESEQPTDSLIKFNNLPRGLTQSWDR
jgi:hypothetical protein